MNGPIKRDIAFRARRIRNPKVLRYLRDLSHEINQRGASASAWLNGLRGSFNVLTANPSGVLADFDEQDFDDLYQAMFGEPRP